MSKKFEFLKATRFWAMIITAIAVYLSQTGVIDESLAQLIATISGGFLAVKTLDRASETLSNKLSDYNEQ